MCFWTAALSTIWLHKWFDTENTHLKKLLLVCNTADILRGMQESEDITFLQYLGKLWDHLKQ